MMQGSQVTYSVLFANSLAAVRPHTPTRQHRSSFLAWVGSVAAGRGGARTAGDAMALLQLLDAHHLSVPRGVLEGVDVVPVACGAQPELFSPVATVLAQP